MNLFNLIFLNAPHARSMHHDSFDPAVGMPFSCFHADFSVIYFLV
jgi:hypothetical protein